jgi:hypothetical protein
MEQFSQFGDIDQHPWTVEDLIAVAERVIASGAELFAQDDISKDLNVRLIRDYVVREMIPRPLRIGREARFGLGHLVHLLAVRQLLRNQKWSLPAIKASFTTSSTEDLLNGVLSSVRPQIEREFRKAAKELRAESRAAVEAHSTPPLNPAQLLIKKFKADGKGEDMQLRAAASLRQVRASPAMHANSIEIAASMGTEVRDRLHFELDRWSEFVIDGQRLRSLSAEEVERLGEALKSRLKRETAR